MNAKSIGLTLVIALALVTALVVPAGGQGGPNPDPSATYTPPADPTPDHQQGRTIVTVEQYRHIARAVYRHRDVGGDYRARPVITVHQKHRLIRMKRKARGQMALKIMRNITRHQRTEWRFYRYIDTITPFGEWAIPAYIVSCESGGDYTRWNQGGSDASGAYQFLQSTWLSLGGGRYASNAAYAADWSQHVIAARYYGMAGSSPWSCA